MDAIASMNAGKKMLLLGSTFCKYVVCLWSVSLIFSRLVTRLAEKKIRELIEESDEILADYDKSNEQEEV